MTVSYDAMLAGGKPGDRREMLDELLQHSWPAELPPHISPTQIAMGERCWEQLRRRYILGEKERPGAAMVQGLADHKAHETNFRQKIESHEDIPEDDVRLAFAEAFDQKVEQSGGETEVAWGSDKPGEVKDRGVQLVSVYHRGVSPRVQPESVEREWQVQHEGLPVPVLGYIDVETDAEAIERKTSKRSMSEPKPEWRVQGLLYQAVSRKPVHWHVATKTKTPAVYTPKENPRLALSWNPVVSKAAKELAVAYARTVMSLYMTFGPDEPWPGALTHPWACGFCGYRPSCHWWGHEREMAA